jgi:hypothetical protein
MRFIHDNLYALWATLALVAAATCWFGVPEPKFSATSAAPAQSWSLPKLGENESKKSLDAITARNLWGIVAANTPPAPTWSVLGIGHSGADRFVMLAIEGKPAEVLKVGDTLPDGAKIVQIENERFFVLTAEKKKLAFGIYKNEPAK